MTEAKKSTEEMTVNTMASDLVSALVGELKLLPDIWPKIGQDEQQDIIERVKNRVSDNVRKAVHLIASAGRITVAGDLKKVTFADKTEAVFALSKHDPNVQQLCHAQGQACLIIVAPSELGGDEKDARQMGLPGLDGDSHGDANAILEQVRRNAAKKQPPLSDDPPPPPGGDGNDDDDDD